jgi:ABC-type transporter Mla subunit MlaD
MRIRLASQGLTGGLYLEVDYVDPRDNPVPEIAWAPQFPHIPSVKSTGARLIEEAGGILKQLGKVPFQDMGEKLAGALESLDKLLKKIDPSVDNLSVVTEEAGGLIKDLRKTVSDGIGKEFTSVMQDLRKILQDDLAPAVKAARGSTERLPATLERLDAALDRATSALRRTDRLLAEREGSLEEALDNVRVVTQDLREVSGTLKRYPASALFGEAPPRPKSEGK